MSIDRDGNGLACESLPRANPQPTTTKPTTVASTNIHLKFGNPSDADKSDRNNYLMEKAQYALSYNCSTGTANWASWQLNSSWLGSVERSEDFRPDPDIPAGCYSVRPNDYRGSGYDRGHLTPSGDRRLSRHLVANCILCYKNQKGWFRRIYKLWLRSKINCRLNHPF